MHHPTDRIAHTTAFVTPVMEHWLEQEIAQWVHSSTHALHFVNYGSMTKENNKVLLSVIMGDLINSEPFSFQYNKGCRMYLPNHLSTILPIYLYLSTYIYIHPSISFSLSTYGSGM